jgi:hypothetical protein
MAIPKQVIVKGAKGGQAAIKLAFHVAKQFGGVAGRQLRRGGPFANELMGVYKNVIKALKKM